MKVLSLLKFSTILALTIDLYYSEHTDLKLFEEMINTLNKSNEGANDIFTHLLSGDNFSNEPSISSDVLIDCTFSTSLSKILQRFSDNFQKLLIQMDDSRISFGKYEFFTQSSITQQFQALNSLASYYN